jgi:hypothetical protein
MIAQAKAMPAAGYANAKRSDHVLCQTAKSSASMGVILKAQFNFKNPTLLRRESIQLT